MRRCLNRVVLLMAVVVPGQATVAAAAQQVSVKAGASAATIVFSPDEGSQGLPGGRLRTGAIAGVSFLPWPSDRGGVQIEGFVHQKGVRNLLRRDDAIRLTYLEVPMSLHVDVAKLTHGAIFVVAGLAPAFKLQASYEDEGVSEDITDDIETFDLGVHAGGGVEFRRLTIEARYTWGLRTAFHDGELEGAFKNGAFVVMAGVRVGR